MRTTVTIDDELLAKAAELTGVNENVALLRQGLQTLIRVESARRLAALGGTDPSAEAAPRRRRAAEASPCQSEIANRADGDEMEIWLGGKETD
jgi:Arc/MetJ family transcription regulator